MTANNSFKPNLLRYGKGMAERACHTFASTTQVGLTQALGGKPHFQGARMGTDQDWERWGARDAYFGVLSSDKFRKERLNQEVKKEFFATGSAHVERIFRLIKENFDEIFQPARALDFGCGVGRIALPLADRTDETVGADISPSMIAEASGNAIAASITNASFVLADDELTNAVGKFGLVHSYIVLQHIPWARGRSILQQLANKVEPGGYLAVHMFTSSNAPRLVRAAVRLRYALPPLNWLRNIPESVTLMGWQFVFV